MEIKGKVCISVDPEVIIGIEYVPPVYVKRPDLKWDIIPQPPRIRLTDGQTKNIGEPGEPELFKTNK